MWYVATRTGGVVDLDALLESNKALRAEVSMYRRRGCAVTAFEIDECGDRICRECGAYVEDSDNFCPFCGRKFVKGEEVDSWR